MAILLDGGYLLKRLPTVRTDVDPTDLDHVTRSIWQLVRSHLDQYNAVRTAAEVTSLASLMVSQSGVYNDALRRRMLI